MPASIATETADFLHLQTFLKEYTYTSYHILVDSQTVTLCLPILFKAIPILKNANVIVIPQGEENKTLPQVEQIWKSLLLFGADRKSLLINVGGGVVTDIGGFCASTYKRGIDCINIPTTLLSMVDASVGSKTGFDFEGVKNSIGSFAEPRQLFMFDGFLDTLPAREWLSGLAEMLKHGLIYDAAHWKALQSVSENDVNSLKKYIKDSIKIKETIVEQDPKESGLRKILNFGHTIGHAIESESLLNPAHKLLHGEAIALGMMYEAELGVLLGITPKPVADEVQDTLQKWYHTSKSPTFNTEHLMEWMRKDKKNTQNTLNFSLLEDIGKCRYNVEVKDEMVYKIISGTTM